MKIKIFNYFVYSYYGKFQKQKLWGSKSTQIENYIQSTPPSLIFLNGQNFLRKNKKKRKIVPMKEKKNKKENE